MTNKTILALAAIATAQALEPPRRRLRDTVDLTQIKEQAEASAFTGSLSFKLDAGAADAQGADKALTITVVTVRGGVREPT